MRGHVCFIVWKPFFMVTLSCRRPPLAPSKEDPSAATASAVFVAPAAAAGKRNMYQCLGDYCGLACPSHGVATFFNMNMHQKNRMAYRILSDEVKR